ncbi:MAG: redox-sensing transcriptional repressor Rex [bacterium]
MTKIPSAVVARLSQMYRILDNLEGKRFISSNEISSVSGFTAAQIRRDLTYFGQFGTTGKGYNISLLKEEILKILGLDQNWRVALIGVGNLGRALLKYKGFRDKGFTISAAFENDRRKVGKTINGTMIFSINMLKSITKKNYIEMAILTVPEEAAQRVANLLNGSAVKAVLNFTPSKVNCGKSILVHNIDMTVEMEKLSFFAKKK